MKTVTERDHNNLLHKVARAYYEDELTQELIGQRFGLSRIKISRLLRQAREEGIVKISLSMPKDEHVDLERSLENKYGLNEVLIARPAADDAESIRIALGFTAANCLMRTLRGEEIVAFNWGGTLLALVEALQSPTGAMIRDWPKIKIVQSLGGLGSPEADVYSAGLVHRLARTFGAKARILAAPGIVTSASVCRELMKDEQIFNTIELASKADIALMGIGQLTPKSAIMQANIIPMKEYKQFLGLNVVGDIGLRFFDENGICINHEINERVLGLTLEQIKKIPRAIGVAGGPDKFKSIHAALKGKLINVLVTDIFTANRLMEEK